MKIPNQSQSKGRLSWGGLIQSGEFFTKEGLVVRESGTGLKGAAAVDSTAARKQILHISP